MYHIFVRCLGQLVVSGRLVFMENVASSFVSCRVGTYVLGLGPFVGLSAA